LDYQPFVHGLEMTNAHAFRHIAHMEHVQSLSQVGIRSLRNTELMHRDSLQDGNRVLTMADARAAGADGVAGLVPEGAACYVSLDIHVHVLPSADDPIRDGYEIWEYGAKDGVVFSEARGTTEEVDAAVLASGFAHVVAVNLFVADLVRGEAVRGLPEDVHEHAAAEIE